jgi:hypothetical protein
MTSACLCSGSCSPWTEAAWISGASSKLCCSTPLSRHALIAVIAYLLILPLLHHLAVLASTRWCSVARPSQADPRIVSSYQAPQQQGQYGSIAASASGPPPRVKLVLLGDSVRYVGRPLLQQQHQHASIQLVAPTRSCRSGQKPKHNMHTDASASIVQLQGSRSTSAAALGCES